MPGFDEALDQVDQQRRQQRQRDPFDEALDQVERARTSGLRKTLVDATDANPEQEAESRKLSMRFGVPPSVISRNLEDYRKRAAGDVPVEQMQRETPHLTQWLEDNPENAKLAKDDLHNLGTLEFILTAPSRAFAQAVNQGAASRLRYESIFRPLSQEEKDQLNAYEYHATLGGDLGAGNSWFRKAVAGTGSFLANQVEPLRHAAAGAAGGAIVGAGVGSIVPGPGTLAGAATGATTGFEAGMLYGVLRSTFQQEAGGAFQEFSDFKDEHGQTLDPTIARMAALAVGAINAPIEAGAQELLLKSIPGFNKLSQLGSLGTRNAVKAALRLPTIRAALSDAALSYAGTLTGETAQEVAQRAVTILAGELAKAADNQQLAPRTPSDVAQDLLEEAKGAASSFALSVLPGPVAQVAHEKARIDRAEKAKDFFQALGQGAAASETIKRMPEAAQQLLERATAGGPVETLYAPVDTFTQYWQEKGIDPQQVAAELTGDPRAYQRAVDQGGDLAIPTARYATKLAGTEHHQFFAEELRLGPDEMNAREATAIREQLAQQAEAAKTEAAAPPDEATIAIRNQVIEQLVGAGVPRETATSQATLYEHVFGTLAARAGVDPGQLYARYGLKVERAIDQGVAVKPEQQAAAQPAVEKPAKQTPEQRIAALEEELRSANRRAETDALTGVANRAAFDKALPAAEADADTHVVAFDANNFGQVNKQVGHEAGDELLKKMAASIKAAADEYGFGERVFRRGGDEFVVLAPSVYADRIRARAEELFGEHEAGSARVSLSGTTAGTFAEADATLQAAKNERKNRALLERERAREAQRVQAEGLSDATATPATGQGPEDAAGQQPRTDKGGPVEGRSNGDRAQRSRVSPPGLPEYGEVFVRADKDTNQRRLVPEVTREIQRIVDELETFPFVPRTWNWLGTNERLTGNAAGGHAQIVEGAAGAEVYNDILAFSPVNQRAGKAARDVHGTRSQVLAAARAILEKTDIATNLQEGIVRVAEHRAAGDWKDLSRPWLPPSWGTVAPVEFTDELSTAIDDAVEQGVDEGDISFDTSEFDQAQRATGGPTLFDQLLEVPQPAKRDLFAEAQQRIQERKQLAADLAAPGNAVQLERADGHTALAGEDMSRPGGFRVTRFDENGPIGHTEHATLQEAIESALADNYAPKQQVDILDTGEQQPRLPGAGQARQVGKADTTMRAPVQASGEDFNLTAPGGAAEDTGQTELFQPAYHGSPHLFDRFSLQHIGNGEGAQAYGWGLYFAGNKGVADWYRERLAGEQQQKTLRLDGTDVWDREIGLYYVQWEKAPAKDGHGEVWVPTTKPQTAEVQRGLLELHPRVYYTQATAAGLEGLKGQLRATIANLETITQSKDDTFSGSRERDLYDLESVRQALAVLEGPYHELLAISDTVKPGRTYTVEIPEDEDFLSWDLPASRQSEKVQAALRALGLTWEPLSVPTPKQALRRFESLRIQRLAAEDIGIRETLREGLFLAQQASLVDPKLSPDSASVRSWENWYMKHQGLMREKGVIDPTGEQLYDQLRRKWADENQERLRMWSDGWVILKETAAGASHLLRDAGLAGIRYLDQGSRAAGTGSQNYVVVDDNLIDIKEYDQAQKAQEEPLLIQHNVTAENLRHAAKLGGIAVPSLAITKASDSLTNFGEITLIGAKEMADPRGYAKTQVFGADVYSPRYPTIHYKIERAGEKVVANVWRQEKDATGSTYFDMDSLQQEGRKYLAEAASVRAAFLRSQNIDPATYSEKDTGKYAREGQIDTFRTGVNLREAIEEKGLETAYQAYVDQLWNQVGATERIFKGFNNQGNRTYRPHTLENVVAELKKDLRGGEASSNIYGVGQLRAKFTPKFRSLKGIKDAAHLLVDDATFEKVKKEVTNELFSITNDLKGSYKYADRRESFGFVDTVMAVMEDTPKQGLDRALAEYGFENVDADTKQRVRDYLAKLRNLPTEYFEAKITRAVDLAEFAGAVIPDDAPADVRRMLEERGVAVETYPAKDQAARKEAVARFAASLGDRALFQDPQAGDTRRGAIRFGRDRQMTIRLFERADLSTFLHESGHFFLEVMRDLATEVAAIPETERTAAQGQLLADMNALQEWFFGEGKTGDITRDQHEQFARGFEAYLMEGKAPSLELQNVFARFRAWLTGIYRTMKALKVRLTPEVTKVFDRMIASDEAIANANAQAQVAPLFTTADSAGMLPAQFELYRAAVAKAGQTAREQLDRKLMAEVERERSAAYKEQRDAIEAEVTKELHGRPVYQAIAAMQKGTLPDGSPLVEGLESEPLKLSKKILVARYGDSILQQLPKPYIYSAEGGLDPDVVAQHFGYSSGDELLADVRQATPLKQAIRQETDGRMLRQYGGMLLDGTLHEKARAAISNEDRDVVIRAELRALAQLARQVKPFIQQERARAKAQVAAAEAETEGAATQIKALQDRARRGPATIRAAMPPANLLRSRAVEQLAGTRVRDIRPDVFWSASRRAAAKAVDAAAAQDFDGAIAAKQQELMNLALFRAAQAAKEDADARAQYALDLAKPARRAKLGLAGESYLDQVDGILDRYEFARVSQKVLDRRASLRKFVAALEGEGLPVDIPEEVLDESQRRNWRELTYDELVGVTDSLKAIVHLANFKNRLLKAAAKRELDAVAGELADSIREHKPGQGKQIAGDRRPSEERKRSIASFFASHRKLASILRELDGFKDGGPAWDAIMRPLNEAANKEAELNHAATRQLAEIVERAYPGKAKTHLYAKLFIPAIGRSLSQMQRVMVALNWGNEGNRQRIRSAYGWTDAQVQQVLDSLTPGDVTFVKGIFEHLESYWPEIAAKQERVYGIAPAKVEATSFKVQGQEIAGGYFPLKYDDRLSAGAIAGLDLEAANLAKQAAYAQATTKRGHTKERQANVKMPVRLDFGVIFGHVEQVIHDLSHHEALVDVGRILGHRAVQQAILETHGDVPYKQIKDTIRDVAFGDIPAKNGFEQALNHVRMGATIAGLGWNLTTAFLQPLGLANSIVRIGPKWVAKGVIRWTRNLVTFQDTVSVITDKSSFMRDRGRTQQREIAEIRNQVGVETGRFTGYVDEVLSKTTFNTVTKQSIADSFFWVIQQMQRVADVPTWLGAYEKALAGGETEERAIALADQAVLDSQGGGQMKDLAAVQRGGPMMRLWTNFYSYFNILYNQAVEAKRARELKNPLEVGRLAADYLMLFIVPATLGKLLRDAIRPAGPDPDDSDSVFLDYVRENLSYISGIMLGVREMSAAIQGVAGYEGPAGARAFSALSKAALQAQQVLKEYAETGKVDESLDAALLRSFNDVAGILLHYPATQAWRTLSGLAAIAEGQTENPTAVVAGAPKAAAR